MTHRRTTIAAALAAFLTTAATAQATPATPDDLPALIREVERQTEALYTARIAVARLDREVAQAEADARRAGAAQERAADAQLQAQKAVNSSSA